MMLPVRSDRHPSESYEDILDRDTKLVPEILRELPRVDIGLSPVDVAHYTSPEYAALEAEHLWSRIWQMACREEHIPNVGDTFVYEIARYSILITRQKDGSIRAFHNSCLHRGRKLATVAGCRKEFRCPFHGFTWNIDGSFKENPIAWDFPQWQGKDVSLPEAKVATWAGFVFINMDPEAQPFEDYLKPLRTYCDRYELEDCYTWFHVEKKVRANWKAVTEAFMESHHSIITHQQLLPYIADLNSQYDILSNTVSRQVSANLVTSPFASKAYSEDDILSAMMGAGSRADVTQQIARLPKGMTARAFVAERSRQQYAAEDGHDYSDRCDAEMLDALLYNLFPNFCVWGGFRPNLVYRWRPDGDDPAVSIMDIYQLKRVPKGKPRPPAASRFAVGLDEPISEYGPKGGMPAGLAAILEQDMGNMPAVQSGMRASRTGVVELADYSEMRIRLLHQMIDSYIDAGRSKQGDGA